MFLGDEKHSWELKASRVYHFWWLAVRMGSFRFEVVTIGASLHVLMLLQHFVTLDPRVKTYSSWHEEIVFPPSVSSVHDSTTMILFDRPNKTSIYL
jgi:hypothetical protein